MPIAEERKEKNGTCKGIRQRGHREEKKQHNRLAHRLREERIPQSRLWSAMLTTEKRLTRTEIKKSPLNWEIDDHRHSRERVGVGRKSQMAEE